MGSTPCGWHVVGRILVPQGAVEFPHPAGTSSLAALRLEHLGGPDVDRIGSSPRLTPRELAVSRMVSMGHQSADIAQALGLGEETVRSHLKKAQVKLGVHNRTHAACDALRQNLIP